MFPYLSFTVEDDIKIICLQSEAFYALVEEVVDRVKSEKGIVGNKWIRTEEAMELLGIKSKTTLQRLRDQGEIRFSQPPQGKIILYDRDSIMDYLEEYAKDRF